MFPMVADLDMPNVNFLRLLRLARLLKIFKGARTKAYAESPKSEPQVSEAAVTCKRVLLARGSAS